MHNRITDPSSINKPVIGTLNNKMEIYDMNEYQLTPKKLIAKVMLILLIFIVPITTLYFISNLGRVPTRSISVNEVNISSDNKLSFELNSNEYYLSDSCDIKFVGNENGILYITVDWPVIPRKISHKQKITDLLSKKYVIDIKGISAVYYIGRDFSDKLLIWEK